MDTQGRTTAITVISAMPRWWWIWLKFTFARIRLSRPVRGPSSIDQDLLKLSFIHFAHWSLFDRIPPAAPRSSSRSLPHPYLLFQSNFNGGAQEYIESFSVAIKTGMQALWLGAYGTPSPTPIGPFIAYIRANAIPTTYYYAAYPQASTTMVCTALERRHQFDAFLWEASTLGAEAFAAAYDGFVTRVHKPVLPRWKADAAAAGRQLCVLTPISPGREEALRAELEQLPTGEKSPFAATGATHFARFAIVPYLKDRLGDQLDATPYLLFSAEFDGARDRYLDSLCGGMSDLARAVWGRCEGYPQGADAEAFERYLLDHRIEPGYSVIGYPGATVAEVRASLDLDERLKDFFVDAQRMERTELKQAWAETFAGSHGWVAAA